MDCFARLKLVKIRVTHAVQTVEQYYAQGSGFRKWGPAASKIMDRYFPKLPAPFQISRIDSQKYP